MKNATWQGWTAGIIGVWLFIAAFLNFPKMGNMWDDIISGIVVAIIGFLMIKPKPWQGWTVAIMGIWLIIAGFIPALVVGNGNMWNLIISSVLIMVGGFGALSNGNGKAVEAK